MSSVKECAKLGFGRVLVDWNVRKAGLGGVGPRLGN